MYPSISIVMPLFNKASSVVASVRSVQDQTVTDWELIVVDDGSTDNGQELVAALVDERIRIISQANAGVSSARNTGAKNTRCDLIAFLDADDFWRPEFLDAILSLRRDYPHAGMFATCYDIHQADDIHYKCRVRGLPDSFKRGLLPSYFDVAVVSDPPVWSSAVAINGEALKEIGGFPLGVRSGEDLLTWARLAAVHPLAYDARSLALHIVSGIERPPDHSFHVGMALEELLHCNSSVPGLRRYVALWWRMQATMALRFNELHFARQLSVRSLKYDCTSLRSLYVFLLTCLPSRAITAVDSFLRGRFRRGK